MSPCSPQIDEIVNKLKNFKTFLYGSKVVEIFQNNQYKRLFINPLFEKGKTAVVFTSDQIREMISK